MLWRVQDAAEETAKKPTPEQIRSRQEHYNQMGGAS